MSIQSYRNGQVWNGSGSKTQSTAALGMPIKPYGYQNQYGPPGMRTDLGPSGSSASGSGSSGPSDAASQWYSGVMKGDNLPYSPFAIKNLESQATDMNAAAETARNGQMQSVAAANGASASDPSMQGAKMNSMARRQTDNASAVNDIQSKANQANFNAQADAAAHMTQTKLAYDEMANGNAMRYSPFGGGGSGRSTPNSTGFYQPVGNRSSGFMQMGGNDRQPLAQVQQTGLTGNRFNPAPQKTGGQLNVADVWDSAPPRNGGQPNGIWAGPAGVPRKRPPSGPIVN